MDAGKVTATRVFSALSAFLFLPPINSRKRTVDKRGHMYIYSERERERTDRPIFRVRVSLERTSFQSEPSDHPQPDQMVDDLCVAEVSLFG